MTSLGAAPSVVPCGLRSDAEPGTAARPHARHGGGPKARRLAPEARLSQ